MQRVGGLLVAAGMVWAGTSSLVAQGPGGRVSACSLMPKELVARFTPYDKQAFERVTLIPPNEEAMGKAGSACTFGGVRLQVDPFSMSVIESQRKADAERGQPWETVPQLGDVAYFRDNRGRYGELAVRAGARVLTIQMSVPQGRTTEAIKPHAIDLARAILPKLP